MAKQDSKDKSGEKLVCQNRKARHEYFIEDTVEAGLVLTGTEVKSLRQGKGSLQEAYARIRDGEAWIEQFHIPPYEQGNRNNVDPVRRRKLLMHKREIVRIEEAAARKGYTIIPLKVYFRRGYVKVTIGLARGKKLHDKRDTVRQRDQQREIDRTLKSR